MTIERIECWALRAPIDVPVAAAFGSMKDRPAVFVRVTAADGARGWGEVFCNFPQVGAEHRARLVDSIFAPLLVGTPSDDPAATRAHLEAKTRRMAIQCGEFGPFAQISGAFDQALWDMAARRAGLPLWKLLARQAPQAPQAPNLQEHCPQADGRVRPYASGLGPDAVVDMALGRKAAGFTAFKLKVGFGADKDLRNLSALREALGTDAVIMIDANQAWSPEAAVGQMAALAPFRPFWVEEPIAADEGLAAWKTLAGRCGLPLAAGENIRGADHFLQALDNGHLAFIQPDVAKWGGISGGLEVARAAAARGVAFCPHWLGGGVGLAASAHLRAALGPAGFLEVDSNPNPLRDEVFVRAPLQDGWLRLSDAPGLGVEPDMARLARYATPY